MLYKNKRRLIAGISLVLLLVFYLVRELSSSVRVLGFIFGLCVFYLIDFLFKLDFKLIHYYIILVILVFGILLSPFYFLYESYDKILHFTMPILASFLVFHLVERKELNLRWKLLITFMFMISFLTIHEIGEYSMDKLWDLKLQGVFLRDISGLEKFNEIVSPLNDTMIDLILGMIGSFVFVVGSTTSYYYKRWFKIK